MERTLVLLKPDALQRGLIGTIIARFEGKGLKLAGCKMLQLTDELANEHYSHLVELPFFPEIRDFMTSTPIIALCVEGLDSVAVVRRMCGVTLAREADVGTIRGDFAMSIQCNLVHASDSLETAKAEVTRFFDDSELFEYEGALHNLIYASKERE